ncbi:MAG: GNAT family N-acetyltransferase [Bacteroidota bacterium]
MNIAISKATTSDLPLLKALQPAGWGDIMPNMIFYTGSDFCYLVKAVVDDNIVGCGAVIIHGNCAWLANIIVHETYRGKGAGTAITSHLLHYAGAKRGSIILIATKFGYPVYKKLGFTDDEEYTFFSGAEIETRHDERILPYAEPFKDAVFTIDREVTGESREQLLTPKLSDAFVYVNNGLVEGFTIPSLGEGLTLAYNNHAGIALMNKSLAGKTRIALPKPNTAAIDHALLLKLKPLADLYAIKMYKGKRIEWKPGQTFGRVGGNMG